MKPLTLAPRARQRGYMMMLVLVALVAMMISGVALVRSMDTSTLVAGNLASRNATVNSADLGVQQAVTWIQAQVGTGALNADAPANGYYAEAPTSGADEPWTSASFWAQCTTVAGPTACSSTDNAGNSVSWVINRVCKISGSPNAVGNYCSSLNGSASNGGSYSSDAVNFVGSPKYYYRITVQVVDRRNTATLSQAFVTL